MRKKALEQFTEEVEIVLDKIKELREMASNILLLHSVHREELAMNYLDILEHLINKTANNKEILDRIGLTQDELNQRDYE